MTKKQLTISEALNAATHEIMAADERVVLIGEDLIGEGDGGAELGGVFGVSKGLAAAFGRGRVIETPISETAFVGMGVGAAMTGLKPIVEVMFCDFMGVCMDQIINQAAKARFLSGGKMKMPLVIRTTMGAGDSSGAMHSQSLYAMLASVPGLMVMCPSSAVDAAGLLKAAVASDDVCVIFEHKGLYGEKSACSDGLQMVDIGKGRVVREGNALTIVAAGAMVKEATQAADVLVKDGINVEIIDPRTISPLDMNLILESVAKTGKLLVVDEGAAFAGFADAVTARVAREGFDQLTCAPKAITPPHESIPYAPAQERAWVPQSDDIVQSVLEMMRETS